MLRKNDHDNHEQGGVLYNNKTIWFFGDITVNSAAQFCAAMQEADRKAGPIIVNVCSNGGWVEGGLAMADAISCANNKVTTIGVGAVYSSAVLPFQSGDSRLFMPSARMFFHDLSISMGSASAKSADVAIRETMELYSLYCKLVAERSGLRIKDVDNFLQNEKYFNATEALQKNLIDGIVVPQPKNKKRK